MTKTQQPKTRRTYDTYQDEDGNDLAIPIWQRCLDCHRPIYYEWGGDEQYHHAIDAPLGCFLIGPEDREDDPNHPLYSR